MTYTVDNITSIEMDNFVPGFSTDHEMAVVKTDDGKTHGCFIDPTAVDVLQKAVDAINTRPEYERSRKIDEAEKILQEAGVDYRITEPRTYEQGPVTMVRTNKLESDRCAYKFYNSNKH